MFISAGLQMVNFFANQAHNIWLYNTQKLKHFHGS